jgi:hypothetical protein
LSAFAKRPEDIAMTLPLLLAGITAAACSSIFSPCSCGERF